MSFLHYLNVIINRKIIVLSVATIIVMCCSLFMGCKPVEPEGTPNFSDPPMVTPTNSPGPTAIVLKAPQIKASDGNSIHHIQLTWTKIPNATIYQIYRSATSKRPANFLLETKALSYNDKKPAPGTLYYYWIRAYTSKNKTYSTFSSVDTGYKLLRKPANLDATMGSYSAYVKLTWDFVAGATHYYIYRSKTLSRPAKAIHTTTNTEYNDSSATPGIPLYYWIRGYNSQSKGLGRVSDYDEGYRKSSQYDTITKYEIERYRSNLNQDLIIGSYLKPGSVVIFRTASDLYGKLYILANTVDLKFNLHVYNNTGTLKLSRKGLVIRNHYSCDLDTGKEVAISDKSADIAWYQRSGTSTWHFTPHTHRAYTFQLFYGK